MRRPELWALWRIGDRQEAFDHGVACPLCGQVTSAEIGVRLVSWACHDDWPDACLLAELALTGAQRRPLAVLLTANVISITGSSLTLMGVPWLVLQSTGSAADAGVVAFCAMLPVTLAALLGGPVVDRASAWSPCLPRA